LAVGEGGPGMSLPGEKGGHIGPPLREAESIISFAIGKAIREQPEKTARAMVEGGGWLII
jgi:hypothetical protein